MFVNGVHGDLDGLVISIRFSHVAAAGPTALHEVLLTGLAEAQAHHVIRGFLNRFALGLGALLDLLEHVVGEREGLGVIPRSCAILALYPWRQRWRGVFAAHQELTKEGLPCSPDVDHHG
jgi:hypothetical protein